MTDDPGVLIGARERMAYELRREGRTFKEIAVAMKCSESTVKQYVSRAQIRGMPDLKRTQDAKRLDMVAPEAAAEAVVAGFTETRFDREVFLKNADEAGIPPRMAVALANRITVGYTRLGVGGQIKRLKREEMAVMLEEKISMAAHFLDDAVLAAAPAKDLAYTIDRLIEKHQLLNDRPTQVFDVHASLKLGELLVAAQREAARRGITIEQKPVVIVDEEPRAAG